jgi:hypothetical protein
MPKINGRLVDPKVYAKRVTAAKKTLAKIDPELKKEIAQMYPKTTKEQIVKKQLSPKPKVSASKPSMKPAPKASKKLTGEAAARQYQKEISPKGMASAKAAQSKALDKKYPNLYKKKK